jgi:hypothetical protein
METRLPACTDKVNLVNTLKIVCVLLAIILPPAAEPKQWQMPFPDARGQRPR